jgi:preprotein translocase subunit SecA
LNAWNHLVTQEATLQQLEAPVKKRLTETLGEEKYAQIAAIQLTSLNEDDRAVVCDVLGWHLQNEACRQLLLRIISDQWVDYLTNVEALRISIRMEAYAQKDPLVEYKGRATDMFQTLLAEIRMGVVSRLFTYNPGQRVSAAAAERPAAEEAAAPKAVESASESSESTVQSASPAQPRTVQQQPADSGGKRHKRHKKR